MKFPALFAYLICLFVFFSATMRAGANSVELIAGWNFGQFVTSGIPTTNPETYEPVTSITSNYTGTTSPSPEDGGVYRAQNAGSGFFSAGTGVLDFSSWIPHDGTSPTPGGVTVFEVTNIEAANGTIVTGRNMFGGDDNNAQLRFTSGQTTDFTLSLSTSGYSDFDPSAYFQDNDFNLTLAAYKFSGASASIEWYYDGIAIGNTTTSSQNPAAFNIDLPSNFFGKSNAVLTGRVTGDIAIDHLQINGIRATPVSFTNSPASQSVTAGSNVTFTVTVSGAASPTYQWRRNGVALFDTGSIAGATTSTLVLTGVTTDQAGNYTVVAVNNGATAESEPGVLTVNTVPVITGEPSSSSANPGESITFTVEATGSPAPSYLWYKNNVALSDGAGVSGATTRTLSLTNLTLGSSGEYTVKVSNDAGSVTSVPATLTVTENTVAPAIQVQPSDVTVNLGQEAVFVIAATGAPAPSYQWFVGETALTDGNGIDGANKATLRITPGSAAQAGSYLVVVSNKAGTITSNPAALTVRVAPAIPVGSGPNSQAVNVGSNATFTVSATGLPAPTFQWFKGDVALGGQTASSLVLTGVTLDSAGDYTVVATNAAGSVRSDVANLTVYVPAQIITDPVGLTVGSGSAFTLSVTATGTPAPTYQWRKNGEDILNAIGSTYTVTTSTTADAGEYTVVANNAGGSDTSAAAKVEVAVRLPRLAGPQNVAPGSLLILDSQFRSDGGYRFQWLRNGKAIPGATGSTYLISKSSAKDTGTYSVRVSASSGRFLKSLTVVDLRVTVAGSYDALLRDVVSDEVIGRVQVAVTGTGMYTGSIAYEDGKVYSFKGNFSFPQAVYQGEADSRIVRAGELTPLNLAFNLDARASTFAVALSLGDNEVITARAQGALRASSSAVAWKGRYTLQLEPVKSLAPVSVTLTANIDAKGNLALSGKLPDGASIKASIPSSVNATYAVFLQPYKNSVGQVTGGLTLVLSGSKYGANESSSGLFSWVKPAVGSASAIDLSLEPTLAPR